MTDREIFLNTLDKEIDIAAGNKMADYYAALIKLNEQINLTAITGPEEAAGKHFNDSLASLEYIPAGAKVLDIGTGGGFPGVPVKIARDDVSMTLMDSLAKKTNAVKSLCLQTGIDVNVVCARAEEAVNLRGHFDVALSRAVTSLPALLEISIPLIKKGGIFIAYKQADADDIKNISAAEILGAELTDTKRYGNKILLVFTKTKNTPDKYPRRYSQIKKNPL